MHRRRILTAGLPIAAALCLAAASPAMAGPAFDFLFSVSSVNSDQQYFLNLAVDNYGYTRAELDPVLPRLRTLDGDLPVAMFLAHESGEPLSVIVGLRAQGLAWSVVFGRLRVAPRVLFVGIDRDPGPPYGKAWGHWKRNPKKVRLSDGDIVGLVQIQVGSRWARMTPYEMARARGQGKTVSVLVSEKKGRPWKAHKAQQAGKRGSGKGQGDQGKGKSGKGPSKPRGNPHGGGNPTSD